MWRRRCRPKLKSLEALLRTAMDLRQPPNLEQVHDVQTRSILLVDCTHQWLGWNGLQNNSSSSSKVRSTADESERHVTARALSIAVLASQAAQCTYPTETTCSVSDVILCTHLHRKSETESLKPMGMTRDCRSSFCTHPRSTHPDRHTPLHVKTLDFTWFTATRTRLSSRSPLVRTACDGTRDLCTAGEGTVRVDVCRFCLSSFPINQCPETAQRLRPVNSSSNS